MLYITIYRALSTRYNLYDPLPTRPDITFPYFFVLRSFLSNPPSLLPMRCRPCRRVIF